MPFAPEAPASGINETGFFRACWYRRTFEAPSLCVGQRLILHFGAVDHVATVWVNGVGDARHEGGYTPFEVDVTSRLVAGVQTLIVRAEDDPQDLYKPRGKQDWRLRPHSIWYQRTTGIWQTVWLERVSTTYIGSVRWTSNLDRWELGLDATLQGVDLLGGSAGPARLGGDAQRLPVHGTLGRSPDPRVVGRDPTRSEPPVHRGLVPFNEPSPTMRSLGSSAPGPLECRPRG